MAVWADPQFVAMFTEGRQHVKYVTVASLALLVCDYISTLDMEVSRIWRSRWSLGKFLFLLSRYSVFIDAPLFTYILLTPGLSTETCWKSTIIANVFSPIGIASSEATLMMCLYALFGAKKKYLILMSTIYAANTTVAFTLVILFLTRFTVLPSPLPTIVPCFTQNPIYMFVDYCLLLGGELAMMIVAVALGFSRYKRSRSSLVSTMYRDGVFYYVVLSLITSSSLIAALRLPGPQGDIFSSLLRVMHPILSNRMLLHVRCPTDPESKVYLSTLVFGSIGQPGQSTNGTDSDLDMSQTSSRSEIDDIEEKPYEQRVP